MSVNNIVTNIVTKVYFKIPKNKYIGYFKYDPITILTSIKMYRRQIDNE